MYKKIVAHFIRKNTQLRASFIQNQILNHIEYKPVIIYRYHSDKLDGGFAEFNENNIPTLNLSEGKKIDVNFRYLKKLSKKDLKKVLKFLDENNVNILHFHYGSDACIYSDVIRLAKSPSVVSFYGYDSSSFKDFFSGYGGFLLRNRLFPHITKILAMSPDMKNDLLKSGCPEEKIIVHYYGTDVNKFYLNRIKKENKIVTFTIISGLEPQKGHIFLLSAFLRAYKINKKIRLKIFGSGSIEEKIKKFIHDNNMSSFVKMKGPVVYGSNTHLNVLQNADAFIHPSVTAENGDKEGIPGAIVEAMAAGLPVISTYHAGIPYIIQHNVTGLLVDEWNIEQLTNAILDLANDPIKRKSLGNAAQDFALNHLDLFKKEKELEDIYNSLIEKK